MGTRITLDAHTLIWFFHTESNNKLSRQAMTIIIEAEENGTIYVPTVVLMEVMRILEKRKYPVPFDEILQYIEENEAYKAVPLTTKIIKVIRNLQSRDLHDRVIIVHCQATYWTLL
jgi:PIN domain nuclease of toxin-antitoxin system